MAPLFYAATEGFNSGFFSDLGFAGVKSTTGMDTLCQRVMATSVAKYLPGVIARRC